jgi:hypothetical protein
VDRERGYFGVTMMLAGAAARRHQVASIAYRAGVISGGNVNSFTAVIPAAAHVGDVALLFFDYNVATAAINAGPNLVWTAVGVEQQDAAEVASRVWVRTLVGGDPGTTITIGLTAVSRGNIAIAVYSGVDGSTPIAGFAQTFEAGTTDQHVTPTVVNNTTNAWRVDYVCDKTATPCTTIWSVPGTAIKRLASYGAVTAGTYSAVIGDTAGPVLAGGTTQGGVIYDSDLSTAKATMWTILLNPGGSSAGNPNSGLMILGLYNNCTTSGTDGNVGSSYPGDTSAHYAEINAAYMDATKVKVRRSFNTGLPANLAASSGASDAANGLTPCISVKSDPATTASGSFDATITTLAASMPAGSYLIWHHEPENDMPGAGTGGFTPASIHFYDVAKAANPNLLIGPSYMAYQWRAGQASTATPDDWWVGVAHCDFLACDAYIFDFQAVVAGIGSSVDSGFTRWHSWASLKGKPLILTELGIEWGGVGGKQTDADRVTMLTGSLDYLKAQGYAMVLYWNGYHSDAGVNNINITPTLSDTAGHASVLSVWNAKVAAYGATSSDIRDLI